MNQQDYLKSLKIELEKRNVGNVEEIIADYKEHFAHALEAGKTDDEVIRKLGLPDLIAQAHETEAMIKKVKAEDAGIPWGTVINSIGRLFIIAPFNFIFLFIPAVIIISLVFAGWSVSGAIAAVALALFGVVPGVVTSGGTLWAMIAVIFTSLGILGLAVMGLIVMYSLTKFLALAVINYLQWNLKFILAK
ncbi:DUF1700 domain-containing protein [Bdellovibrio sp. HCB337]|uniref:DUF1700 domain-containing protein n=1 Tax=Bdellovibrio sp. HCB337 TaxID=3394358 RepID=UPI0039A423E6